MSDEMPLSMLTQKNLGSESPLTPETINVCEFLADSPEQGASGWWSNKSPELVNKATDRHVKAQTEMFLKRKEEQRERARKKYKNKKATMKKGTSESGASAFAAESSSSSTTPIKKKSTSELETSSKKAKSNCKSWRKDLEKGQCVFVVDPDVIPCTVVERNSWSPLMYSLCFGGGPDDTWDYPDAHIYLTREDAEKELADTDGDL